MFSVKAYFQKIPAAIAAAAAAAAQTLSRNSGSGVDTVPQVAAAIAAAV